MVVIRELPAEDINRIGEIDRSEYIASAYKVEDGVLQNVEHTFDVPSWNADEVAENIAYWLPELQNGGVLLGAFVDERFVGFAILGHRLFGDDHDQMQLVALYVSKDFRRQGIASQLTEEVSRLAKARGAKYLYISATESQSAVGFYTSRGSELVAKVNEELFALEPKDIHLLKKL
jgi:ribosomal protein S18 acetylase RimI-like enzyme